MSEFRLLVCGGRDFSDRKLMDWALRPYLSKRKQDLLIIEGGYSGADRLARYWAHDMGATVMEFPANWKLHGKGGGPIRNREMLRWGRPDTVMVFPGGKGTADMARQAKAAGIDVVEINPEMMKAVS